jgi:transglutaminase-like putative cysteine protease
MRYVMLFIASLLLTPSLSAQSKLFQEMKRKYPTEAWVYTERSKVLTISVQQDSLISSAVIKESILDLKDQQTSGTWRVFGSDYHEIKDLQAKATVTDMGRTKEIVLPSSPKRHEDNTSIFFDDSYFYQISFPVRKEGNIESWSYKEIYRDPKFLPSFYFYGYLPLDESFFVIKVSKGVDLAWEVYNDPTHAIAFRKYDKGAFTYFEWSVNNFSSPPSEENCPNMSYYIPHVVYYVKSYTTKNGSKKNVLASVDDLYREYRSNVKGLTDNLNPHLDSLVNTLVNKSDTDTEKVRKIFYWVQDHIRYIAFEDGMRGFIPHHPNYIFEKRYGDCKDMASLLVGLLKIAGVKAYYTLIGTRDLPYQYTSLPTPLVDDHMIATYIDDNKNYFFLDATGNYTRLGLPSSMIQEKEALIITSSGYEIQKVPKVAAELNYFQDSVTMRLNKKILLGKASVNLNGYEKINTSYSIDKANSTEVKNSVVQLVKKGSNKFYLDTFKISNLRDRDIPLRIDYDFHIEDYVNELGNEIYVNLNLTKPYYNDLIPPGRKLAIEHGYEGTTDECYTLNFPEGYDLSYLPANASFQSKTLDFDIHYTVSGKRILLRAIVKRHVLLVTPSLFSDWNDAVGQLSKAYKETIIFKQSK